MYNKTNVEINNTKVERKDNIKNSLYVAMYCINVPTVSICYNFGPDPNMYWFHTIYDCATMNGEYVGTACYATYSPRKPTSDRFQD